MQGWWLRAEAASETARASGREGGEMERDAAPLGGLFRSKLTREKALKTKPTADAGELEVRGLRVAASMPPWKEGRFSAAWFARLLAG